MKKTRTVLRDSGDGRFITKKRAARKNPNTWQRETVSKAQKRAKKKKQ